jgi:hypothetical protein
MAMKIFSRNFICVLLMSAAGLISVRAQTVTLTSVADTDIEQFHPDANSGGAATAVSGALGAPANHEIRRMLLRFDLSGQVPAGAVINSATLSVQVTRVPSVPVSSTFGLRRVLAGWTENAATWNSRLAGVHWQTPGATGVADAANTPSSTVFVSGLGRYVFPSTAALVADVQAWADNPSGNSGWLLVSGDEASFRTARHFATRESGAIAPVLTITYTVAPLAIIQQPQSQTVFDGTPVQFSVSASGAPPISYQWQFGGHDLPGETNAILNLDPATLADAGSYTVVVRNASGSLVSDPAVLTVQPVVLPLPRVAFIEPANGSRFLANTAVNVAVDAAVSNATISEVDFFLGTNLVGKVTSSPFTLVLTNLAPGAYQLTAAATASTGTSNSAVVSFTVLEPLSVRITQPTGGQKFPLGTNILLQAAIPANTPAVSTVDFFAGDTLVGEATGPTFTFDWIPAAPGDFMLTAVAADEFGETATSLPVPVRVFIPEAVPPTVRITQSPPNFAHLSHPTISLAGRASDNVGLDRVEARDNDGNFQPATGTTSWSAEITLAPGLNIVQVRSVDLAGNTSQIVTRFYTFVQHSPLTVQTVGEGSVTPDLNGHRLEIGKPYKVRAVPAAGQLFAGWLATAGGATNGIQPNAVLNFIMQSNLTLSAEFIPNPFLSVQGSYAGLILNTNVPAPESSGVFSLRVLGSGAFSGRFVLQGKAYRISGRFDTRGNVRFAIIRPGNRPIAVSLSLDITNQTDTVRGTATDGTWTAQLLGNRNVFNAKTNPVPAAGDVHFALENPADTSQPEALGIATLKSNGRVEIAGRLANGSIFSFDTILAKDGSAPFFVLSNAGDEMLAGWMNLTPVVGGRIDWVRAAANGFSLVLDATPNSP